MRIEREGGHRFVPDVVEAFPGEIQAISVSKPALEDVFIHRTGHKFWSEEREANPEEEKERGGSLRPMILVLSLVLGVVPLAGVAWIFASGMITLSPSSHGRRTIHDPHPADALRLLPAERVLGDARPRHAWARRSAPAKAPAAKAS